MFRNFISAAITIYLEFGLMESGGMERNGAG
jgi:hypothetical protein